MLFVPGPKSKAARLAVWLTIQLMPHARRLKDLPGLRCQE
jgi:hypothetical protein